MNRYKLLPSASFERLVDADKSKEVKRREEAFYQHLLSMKKIAGKKVENDELGAASSFMNRNNFGVQLLRYKNAAKKYTQMQSSIKDKKVFRSKSNISKVKTKLIELNNKKNVLDELNSNFRGATQDYYIKLTEIFGKNIVDKYILNNDARRFPPKSVIMRDSDRFITNQIAQHTKRLGQRGYISATKENFSRFVGKNLSNKKSKRELELDEQKIESLNKAMKTFENQREFISFDGIFNKLAPFIQLNFRKKFDSDSLKFKAIDDEQKKVILQEYLKENLDRASNKIRGKSIFKNNVNDLKKLNGYYVENNKNADSSAKKDTSINSPVYTKLCNEYNSLLNRYTLEQKNLDEKAKEFFRLKKDKTFGDNKKKLSDLEKNIADLRIKVSNLKLTLDSAQRRKVDFEKTYAEKEVKKAIVENKNFGINTSYKVLDFYNFPLRSRSGEKEVLVQSNSPEGKMIEQNIRKFLANYHAQLDRFSVDIQKYDDELNKYIFDVSRKITDDFGKNLRSLKNVQKKINSKLETIDKNDPTKDEFVRNLEVDLSKLNKLEKDLIEDLNKIGVDIKKVNLKKEN